MSAGGRRRALGLGRGRGCHEPSGCACPTGPGRPATDKSRWGKSLGTKTTSPRAGQQRGSWPRPRSHRPPPRPTSPVRRAARPRPFAARPKPLPRPDPTGGGCHAGHVGQEPYARPTMANRVMMCAWPGEPSRWNRAGAGNRQRGMAYVRAPVIVRWVAIVLAFAVPALSGCANSRGRPPSPDLRDAGSHICHLCRLSGRVTAGA